MGIVAIVGVIMGISYSAQAGFSCAHNPCVYGICMDDIHSVYSCYCTDGYTGMHCQTNWDECWSSPCKNGAPCIDGIASYSCVCPPGFSGLNCEENINECASNPCINNGTCVDMLNGYYCNCQLGYAGSHCEQDLSVCNTTGELFCHNGGVCVDGPGMKYSCICQPGWSGKTCQNQINACLSSPCKNGAVCLDFQANYTCACSFGFTGKNCDIELDMCEVNICENEALCLKENNTIVCYCVPDYHGDRCQYQYDECQLGFGCLNGGTCIDGIDDYACSCPDGITGKMCECVPDDIGKDKCSAVANFTNVNYTTTAKSDFSSFYDTTFEITQASTIEANAEGTTDSYITLNFYTTDTATNFTTSTFFENSSHSIFTSPPSHHYSTPTTSKWKPELNFSRAMEASTSPYPSTFDTTTRPITTDVASTSIQITTDEYTDYTTESFFRYFQQTDGNFSTTIQTSTVNYGCIGITCRNGGTCLVMQRGPKCSCLFGWEGKYCERERNIQIAAFTGQSYLTHALNNGTSTIVELKIRTLSAMGVVFYAEIAAGIYMTLFVQYGYLNFQFSCGLQTMLFSETKYRINNGYEISILGILALSNAPFESECSAALRLNDTVSMSGEQAMSSMLNQTALPLLYIGGFPKYLRQQMEMPINEGITACMRLLKIDGVMKSIYGSSIDGADIKECSSLACLSNPCYNAATCLEYGDSWNCLCPTGYVGKTCNQSVCVNNPCKFGATCVLYPTNSFLCLCPMGKQGLFCEQDLDIGKPSFSSTISGYSSYLAYNLPPESVINEFKLSFKILPRSLDQISVMIYLGHDILPDHLVVSFIKGYVALTWNLGSGPRRIFTVEPINQWSNEHLIKIGRRGSKAWLSVNNSKNITGRSYGSHKTLDVKTKIFIGGHDSYNFASLPHDLPLHTGFSGCIYDVEFSANKVALSLDNNAILTGRSVGQCGMDLCHNFSCQHSGVCLQQATTFSCLCSDGWYGPTCSHRYNLCDSTRHKCAFGSTCVPSAVSYECDCPVGRSGKYCQNAETELSDLRFSGERSYVQLSPLKNDVVKQFDLSFELNPADNQLAAVVAYIVNQAENFISTLTMVGTGLEFRVFIREDLDETIVVRSLNVLALKEWSKVKIGRYGQKIYLSTNGVTNSADLPRDDGISRIANYTVYFGGLENMSDIRNDLLPAFPVPFSGCLRKPSFNGERISLKKAGISSGRNVADCDGTRCGSDVCANGGTCWLNIMLQPHCTCTKEYTGERCEVEVSCAKASCKNNGHCITENNNPRCHCPLGWMGSFCEIEMPSGAPFLTGDSYIIVDKLTNSRTKRKNREALSYMSLAFSTTQKNGLLLWSSGHRQYIGAGVKNGRLLLTWTNQDEQSVHLNTFTCENVSIDDGVVHNFTVEIKNKKSVTIALDYNEDCYTIYNDSSIAPIQTDGLFYVGGFPDSFDVKNETRGLFENNFTGCVQRLSLHENNEITNFSRYKGQNVETCYVLQ